MIRLSYLICATPRSGSNWLCELLRATAVAGHPDEYLWYPDYSLQRILDEGTGDNGVFGCKLMWDQLSRAASLIASLLNPHYLWLRRTDKVRQGISYYRALESKRWRSFNTAQTDPDFDFEAMKSLVQLSTWEDSAWADYFSHQRITPLELTYEELSESPSETVGRVLDYLGLSAAPLPKATLHERQADALTEEWVLRYQQLSGAEA